MKTDTHPQYFTKATVKCSCGKEHVFGSTKEKMTVEICSNCHPFYTGKEKLVDTAGRVEKFKSRQERAKTRTAAKKPAKKAVSKTAKSTAKPAAKKTATKKPAKKSKK